MNQPAPEHEDSLLPGLDYPSGSFDLPADLTALRSRLLRDTTHVVHGRRRRKKFLRMAGWGMAYAAGALSVWFALRPVTSVESPKEAIAVQQPPKAAPTTTKKQPALSRRVTPEELRARVAGAKRDEQIELLRRAGDLYLNERNDLRSAVTCYQQVLELAETPEQLAVLPDDSWLLAELKNSQRSQ
jgi:hypothetical protein